MLVQRNKFQLRLQAGGDVVLGRSAVELARQENPYSARSFRTAFTRSYTRLGLQSVSLSSCVIGLFGSVLVEPNPRTTPNLLANKLVTSRPARRTSAHDTPVRHFEFIVGNCL